jgi:thiosulfate/3-mercaptopyruvate sulfurtransferase
MSDDAQLNDVHCRAIATGWLVRHLHDRNVRVLEVSSTPCVYKCGHIPGAQYLDWRANEPKACERFEEAFKRLRVGPETLVVLYGDDNNKHALAACALIQKCHPRVCILEGGKARWVAEGRTISREVISYPSAKPDDLLAELDPVAAYRDVI